MIKKIDEIQTFSTADFVTICALHYFGFEIESLKHDPRSYVRVSACFTRTQELDDVIRFLRNKQLSVEPVAFLETTRAVKARLRDCT